MDQISKQFKDQPMSSMDTAIFWIEYISRHGKDALRSPLVDMPYWQAALLDVYGFIVVTFFIIVFVTFKLLTKIYNAITKKLCKRFKLFKNKKH